MRRNKPTLSSQAGPHSGEGSVEPSIWRWESGSRAYMAEITYDLFGDLILRCTNSGIGKRHYQERTIACGAEAIRDALRHLSALRRSHGYTVVETRASDTRPPTRSKDTGDASVAQGSPSASARSRRSPQFFQRCPPPDTKPTGRQGVRSDIYLRNWLGA